MPPQISDEDSVSESEMSTPAPKQEKKIKLDPSTVEDDDRLMVESNADEDDDEDEQLGEDEFVVEKITDHLIDEDTGVLKFEVKWEGFEKKSERTWEPEENLLETASKVLNEYLAAHGGKDAIMAAYEEKKAARLDPAGKRGKKRGRQPSGTPNTNGTSKRAKKNSIHPHSTSPPASADRADFKVPTGSWEEHVINIDACEGKNGKVNVFLTWKGGEKSQHTLNQVYKRCPQKMLKFYESHLVFKKNEDTEPKIETEDDKD